MSFLISPIKSSPDVEFSPDSSSVMSKSVTPALPFNCLNTTISSGYVMRRVSSPFFFPSLLDAPLGASFEWASRNFWKILLPWSTKTFSIWDNELPPWFVKILRQIYILDLLSTSDLFLLPPFIIAQMIRMVSIAIWLKLDFKFFFVLIISLVKVIAKQLPR